MSQPTANYSCQGSQLITPDITSKRTVITLRA